MIFWFSSVSVSSSNNLSLLSQISYNQHTMVAQDIQMPRFGRAGNSADAWGESDGLDVDMLTEFLLNDGSLNANGVTFDFS